MGVTWCNRWFKEDSLWIWIASFNSFILPGAQLTVKEWNWNKEEVKITVRSKRLPQHLDDNCYCCPVLAVQTSCPLTRKYMLFNLLLQSGIPCPSNNETSTILALKTGSRFFLRHMIVWTSFLKVAVNFRRNSSRVFYCCKRQYFLAQWHCWGGLPSDLSWVDQPIYNLKSWITSCKMCDVKRWIVLAVFPRFDLADLYFLYD